MTSGDPFVPFILDDALSTDLTHADGFCFSCEQIFSSRKFLEEHVCSIPTYICSCGTEFTSYKDMLGHNSTHEPGYQVLCHETIKKRRIEKHWEEEEKLQRLQSGEIIWETPKSLPIKAASQRTVATAKMLQAPVQSLQPRQVPDKYSQASSPTMLQNVSSSSDTSKVFSDVGAPTVDLWTLFQPIVVVPSVGTSSKTKTYSCGKCGQSFVKKKSLVIHHNTLHNVDKISGCIGCGLLLSSRKIVPRFHSCNSPHVQISNYKFKLVTARPLNHITPIANGQGLAAVSSSSLKASNHSVSRNNFNPRLSVAKQPVIPVSTKTIISSASLSKVNNPATPQTAPGVVSQTPGKGFECRVCHVYFESVNVLQRHKCAKAHEFLMKHKLSPANRQRPMPMRIANSSLPNIGQQTAFSNIGSKDLQNKMSDNKETTVSDADDDCFIVESGPEKPAEVIYQLTSSVPIKT